MAHKIYGQNVTIISGGGGGNSTITWTFAQGYGPASGYVTYLGENNELQSLELSGTQTVKSIGLVKIWNSSIAQITQFSENLQVILDYSYGWTSVGSIGDANFVVMPKEGCTITLNSND